MRPVVAALALALATGAALAAPLAVADGTRVQMVDNDPDLTSWHFDPAELTVPAGSTVVWHNGGKEDHTVTADDKSFDSGLKKPGTDFQRVFPKVGRYTYHCVPHPWMTAAIKVVAAADIPTAASAATGATVTTAVAGSPGTTTPFTPPTASGTSGSPETVETTTSEPTTIPSGDTAAAPAAGRSHSRRGLAGTMALVLVPTLAGLAIGAKLRRRSRP